MTMAIEEDPFDTLLSLEDGFYKEGYDLGVSDGDRAGRVDGRLFGLEKGFEKYATMGKLHGRAVIWAGRIPGTVSEVDDTMTEGPKEEEPRSTVKRSSVQDENEQATEGHAPLLPASTRLEMHIRTLYALAEPESLSTENNEDSVSDFDDRLKRAEGKVKILEKLTGELGYHDTADKSLSQVHAKLLKDFSSKIDDGSIEDISSLHARH